MLNPKNIRVDALLKKNAISVQTKLIDNTSVTAQEAYPVKLWSVYIKGTGCFLATTTNVRTTPVHWTIEETLSVTAIDCTIEFNGSWIRRKNRKYRLVTEETPFVFWVNSDGKLYGKQYQVSETVELAQSVVKVVAIRGWKSTERDSYDDQGLIVAYIKQDGKAYYRNYCLQLDNFYIWEIEREIALFTAPVDNIALFRTNDFRVGFIAEMVGQIYWVLTTRNYAGMSISPENVKAGLTDYQITVFPIQYTDTYGNENITTGLQNMEIYCCLFDAVVIALSVARVSTNQLSIDFNYNIQYFGNLKEYMTVINASGNSFPISTIVQSGANKLLITMASNLATSDLWVNFNQGVMRELTFRITTTCVLAIEPFSLKTAGSPPNHINNLSVGLTNYIIVCTQIYHSDRYRSENISASLTNYSILVIRVGINPL